MSGTGSPDVGTPVISVASEQPSSAAETAGVEHTPTPANIPAIDRDATVLEDHARDTVLEAPPDATVIEGVREELGSESAVAAGSDPTLIENQAPVPHASAPARFGKRDFFVDTVGLDGEPIPLVIPKAPPTRWQTIRQAASRVASRVLSRK